MERERQNGTKFVDANREHLERSKIRIASRQWVIERILANKYGPKPTVVVNNQQNTVSLDPAEAAAVSARLPHALHKVASPIVRDERYLVNKMLRLQLSRVRAYAARKSGSNSVCNWSARPSAGTATRTHQRLFRQRLARLEPRSDPVG